MSETPKLRRDQKKVQLDGHEPNKRGRPRGTSIIELTPEIIQRVTTVIRFGSYMEIAATLNGVGASTFRDWVLKGKRNPDSIHAEFSSAIKKALAEAEVRDLATIDQHANGRDAVYEMQPVREYVLDKQGQPILQANGSYLMQPMRDAQGKPVMEVARDSKGDPILKRSEVKSQWTAAAWKLERRNPARWGRNIYEDEFKRELSIDEITDEDARVNPKVVKAILEKMDADY